ncbi:hypothetical protein EYF80_060048 [Liparis tanakae]|uniref:Uncharacterized protein n=1 Tax=Liparis tanakae TaxID=230148 RepID=A0A4Z2ELS6_9TELE|nr:hypothetical protein EYF80_060048 [Liparis tanakae]
MTRAGEPLVSETTRRLTSPQAAPDRRRPQNQHLLADPVFHPYWFKTYWFPYARVVFSSRLQRGSVSLTRPVTQSQTYCWRSSSHSSSPYVNDGDDLEEGDDEQRNGAHVGVKDLHPVVPRTQGEDESDEEGCGADAR